MAHLRRSIGANLTGLYHGSKANMAGYSAGKATQKAQNFAPQLIAQQQKVDIHQVMHPPPEDIKKLLLQHGYKNPDEAGITGEEKQKRETVLESAYAQYKSQLFGNRVEKEQREAARLKQSHEQQVAESERQRQKQTYYQEQVAAAAKRKQASYELLTCNKAAVTKRSTELEKCKIENTRCNTAANQNLLLEEKDCQADYSNTHEFHDTEEPPQPPPTPPPSRMGNLRSLLPTFGRR